MPRPRHLRPLDDVAAAGQPLLRQEWSRLFAGAFPFSMAENLRIGVMGDAASSETRSREEEASRTEEEMGDGGSAPSPFIARGG